MPLHLITRFADERAARKRALAQRDCALTFGSGAAYHNVGTP